VITEYDLQEAIAECQGERNPTANTCIKLAAFYILKDHLFPAGEPPATYSFASGPTENTIQLESGSEFSRMVNGRDPGEVWPVMDELMDTLAATWPRLYDGVMRELQK